MGYYTNFTGDFKFSREATEVEYEEFKAFCEDNQNKDPWKHGLYKEPDGRIDYPCRWFISSCYTRLMIDPEGKSYYYEEWLRLLVSRFFKPKGIVLNGEVHWSGEEVKNCGVLTIKDNLVNVRKKE